MKLWTTVAAIFCASVGFSTAQSSDARTGAITGLICFGIAYVLGLFMADGDDDDSHGGHSDGSGWDHF